MKFLPPDRTPKVAVVGFGYVGSCVAATLAGCGISVCCIDNDRHLVEEMRADYWRFNEPGLAESLARALDDGALTLTDDYQAVKSADVIIIAVGTPVDARRAIVTEHLEEVCAVLAPLIRPGQLIIVKSTVAPGTTTKLVRSLLEEAGAVQGLDFGLAFCPERLAEGSALAQFRTLPIVVGGCDKESADSARAFWAAALDVDVLEFSSPEVAELVKLAGKIPARATGYSRAVRCSISGHHPPGARHDQGAEGAGLGARHVTSLGTDADHRVGEGQPVLAGRELGI